ncbi:hypothetical protein G7046_g5882 [Stylonectria norvegica]|nr:hypothetical protein G7046_g5882 [Stylonectria norvegica]
MHFASGLAAMLAYSIGISFAHVIMIEPHPFNLDSAPLLQSWPLSAELPFPCQGRFQHAENVTTVTAGATQLVKFWGSAVHGGGSCQFSVAYGDTPPAAHDQWHTIYSLIGGCPAEGEGNLPTIETDNAQRENGVQCGNDSGKECVRQYNIPIPKDMKNGPATFAWTWFNKIGNREMYMSCAPVIVTGGKDDDTFVDTLPPIFIANIPGECSTGPSGTILSFPDPGKYGKVYDQPSVYEDAPGICPQGVMAPVFEEASSGGDSAAPPLPSTSTPLDVPASSAQGSVSVSSPVLPTSSVAPSDSSAMASATSVSLPDSFITVSGSPAPFPSPSEVGTISSASSSVAATISSASSSAAATISSAMVSTPSPAVPSSSIGLSVIPIDTPTSSETVSSIEVSASFTTLLASSAISSAASVSLPDSFITVSGSTAPFLSASGFVTVSSAAPSTEASISSAVSSGASATPPYALTNSSSAAVSYPIATGIVPSGLLTMTRSSASPATPTSMESADDPGCTDMPAWAVGMTRCSGEGEVVCVEPGYFGICNHGWTVSQQLAAGQKCVDGTIF